MVFFCTEQIRLRNPKKFGLDHSPNASQNLKAKNSFSVKLI